MSGEAGTQPTDELNAEAALAAGFDDDTATPTETPAEQQTEQATTQQAGQPPAEPAPEYVQLTKAERDELLALRESQQRQFGTAFGKIGGIERTLQQLSSGAQVEIDQEDIDALRDDFPPLAAALEKVRNLRVLPGAGGVDESRVQNLVAERVSAIEQKFELRLLAKDHPDYQQIDADPAFGAWVAAQPDEFKQKLAQASQAYDSAVVSDAMTRFKQSRKAPAPPAPAPAPAASAFKNRALAAVTPRGVGGPATSNPNDELMAGFNE